MPRRVAKSKMAVIRAGKGVKRSHTANCKYLEVSQMVKCNISIQSST